MLFRTLHRIFGKLRCGSVRAWMHCLAARYPQINMAPNRGVGDSTYRLQIRRDLALMEEDEGGVHTCFAELQWDLSKAFDHVSWHHMEEQARAWGYPMQAWATSGPAYRWSRRVVVDIVASHEVWPRRGIAAGSPFAPYELVLYLAEAISRQVASCPQVTLSVHVDDILQTARGKTSQEVATMLAESAAVMYDAIVNDRQMVIDVAKKGFLIGSSREVVQDVWAALGPKFAGRVCGNIRRLGVDHWLGKKKGGSLGIRKGRFKSGGQRMGRLLSLRKKAGVSGSKVFTMGVVPHVLYGNELVRPSLSERSKMKGWAARASGVHPIGVPSDMVLLGTSGANPEFRMLAEPIIRWSKEAWMRSLGQLPEDGISAKEISSVWVAVSGLINTGRWKQWQGPLAALAGALAWFGWGYTGVTCLDNGEGLAIDMCWATPMAVEKQLRARYDEKVADKLASGLRERGLASEAEVFNVQVVRQALSKMDQREKSLCLSLVQGVLPTGSWLNLHGWQVSGQCECGADHTLLHRLQGCEFVSGHEIEYTRLKESWLIPVDEGPRITRTEFEPVCHIDGVRVAEEDFSFLDGMVYTDGSAINMKTGRWATGGAAAVQIVPVSIGQSVRRIQWHLRAGHVVSAPLMEHVAMSMAAKVAGGASQWSRTARRS